VSLKAQQGQLVQLVLQDRAEDQLAQQAAQDHKVLLAQVEDQLERLELVQQAQLAHKEVRGLQDQQGQQVLVLQVLQDRKAQLASKVQLVRKELLVYRDQQEVLEYKVLLELKDRLEVLVLKVLQVQMELLECKAVQESKVLQEVLELKARQAAQAQLGCLAHKVQLGLQV
jgi:hypothetical protein